MSLVFEKESGKKTPRQLAAVQVRGWGGNGRLREGIGIGEEVIATRNSPVFLRAVVCVEQPLGHLSFCE